MIGPDGLVGRVLRVVQDLGFPEQPTRDRVEGKDVVVLAGIDDLGPVDGEVPVGFGSDEVLQVIGVRPVVLPPEVGPWRHPAPG